MSRRRAAALIALAAAAVAAPVRAQQAPTAPPPAPPPAVADSADVKTLDGIMHAIYDVISGDSGQARNWDRFRSLFAPGARLIPTGPRQGGGVGLRALSPEEYAERAGAAFARQGFYEREVARRSESYGPVTHLFSTYESRHRPADAPFARGINSFQLFNDGARWYVVTIFWWGETPATPIPARYLQSENH